MVNVLRRKLWRDLFASKGLLLAITSIMAAGVTCYVSMQSAYHNLNDAKGRYYRQCRMADFWIDLKKAPLAEIDVLANLPGISQIQPRIQFAVTVDFEDIDRPINGLAISMPTLREPVLNDIVLQQGGYFNGRKRNEVIVNDSFARAHKLSPGRSIHVLMNNRREELFIVGTAISSEYTYLLGAGAIVPDPENYGVFYIQQNFAQDVFGFEGAANQVLGRLSPAGRQQIDPLLDRAEDLLDPYGVLSTTPLRLQPSNQFLSSEIQGLASYATIIPTIFLTVAALVLHVLTTRLARRQRIVVGTFKAIGYSDAVMFWHFLQFGLIVGVAGGVFGGVLGYWSATGMTMMYRVYFEFPDLRSELHWYTYAVGMIVSMLCAGLGALQGARVMLRLQPAEAMRPEPPRRGGKIIIERFEVFWNRLSASWRAALRSMFRGRLRTAAGIFAAAMGASLLVSGFAMFESMKYLIDFQFYRVTRSDVDVTFTTERGEDALWEVRQWPGVDSAEPLLYVPCNMVHGPYDRKCSVTGLPEDAWLMTPRDVDGNRIPLPDTGLVLTRRLANILHVTPGDKVTVEPVKGLRRPVQVAVTRIADSYMGLDAYADIRYLSRLVNEQYAVSAVKLKTDGSPQSLAQLYRELKQTPAVESVVSRQRLIDSLTKATLEYQYASFAVLTGFAGVIFFGSIVNASMVNIAERQREVATYLALGYSEWQVGQLFLRESLLTNLSGTLLGLPIGYFLMWLMVIFYNNDLLRLPIVTAPWISLVTLALSLCFTLAAHGVVQWTIYRMDYLNALKVKE